MSSICYKPSRSPATILTAPRRRWTQADLDELAVEVCNKWSCPNIGDGGDPEMKCLRTDPTNSRLFLIVAEALGRVNGD